MTEKYDYAGAFETMRDTSDWVSENWAAIENALKLAPLAEKVMGEPSEGMMDAMNDALYGEIGTVTQEGLNVNSDICRAVYSAAIAAAKKEIDNDQ